VGDRRLAASAPCGDEEALAVLAGCLPGTTAREQALDAAARATYAYVVQRDLMGL
jgi:hypothetical protein